jgi:hypothetical protein
MDIEERLSAAVIGILSFDGRITIEQADCQVVALSFERIELIRPAWNLAIKTASELCPWLLADDAHEADWSMNLFTKDGLWQFPDQKQGAR